MDCVKIDDEEYATRLEEARKTLETMSPEAVQGLRTKCTGEMSRAITKLEGEVKKFRDVYERNNHPRDYSKDNPVRQAKRTFWLGQIANFVASSIFKLPREVTPTYGYPHGSAKAYEEDCKRIDSKLMTLITNGKNISEAALSALWDIQRNITSDDAKLVAFCESCANTYAAD